MWADLMDRSIDWPTKGYLFTNIRGNSINLIFQLNIKRKIATKTLKALQLPYILIAFSRLCLPGQIKLLSYLLRKSQKILLYSYTIEETRFVIIFIGRWRANQIKRDSFLSQIRLLVDTYFSVTWNLIIERWVYKYTVKYFKVIDQCPEARPCPPIAIDV